MSSPPGLAVVIVSWNVRGLLSACLRSLLADLDASGLPSEVWVIDSGSTDGTPEVVGEAFPAVHLVACEENVGFVRGNNLALDQILERDPEPPEYFWLLNPDTEVQSGATAALVAALETLPRVGVVGPKLLYPDGSLQHSVFRFPGLIQLIFELFPLPARFYDSRLNGRYPRRLYEGKEPFLADHPLGASMMVRAEVVVEVGLLDEGFFMYCEEIDWCWRMREAGWRTCCAPAACVIHHAGQSAGQVSVSSFANLWTSRARLYARHQGSIGRWLAKALVYVRMKHRMRSASPEMVAACEDVLRAWREVW